MSKIIDRLSHAWNAFTEREPFSLPDYATIGASYGVRPDRSRLGFTNERSIIASVYTRLAIDIAQIEIRHVRVDDQDRFESEIKSYLNDCLSVEANLDQGARAFRFDMAMTLFDVGHIAVVPVDTTLNPNNTGNFDILTMRVGTVVQWYPEHIRVRLWNPKLAVHQEVVVPKRTTAIVENPFYAVMNEPNSTLQRLVRKLNLLDSVDEQSSSGKLDIIIQLPYAIKTEAKRAQAEIRRNDIEMQLKGSRYGIAYADATERITQLNRPSENNLLKQVEYLTELLYTQLGITPEVMNGTADEKTMLNYNNRTVEPIVSAFVEAMHRAFLTKTARTQKQKITYFRDPFKLVPIENIAEIADKFTRNEILSSNEIRSILGIKPATDPKADELRNSNMPSPSEQGESPPPKAEKEDSQNET